MPLWQWEKVQEVLREEGVNMEQLLKKLSEQGKEVLDQLISFESGFQPEVINQAIELREELEPLCLRAVELAAEGKTVEGELYNYNSSYFFNIYALLLLGVWHSENGVPVLLRALRPYLSKEEPKIDLWGDSVSELFATVLAETISDFTADLYWEFIKTATIQNAWIGGVLRECSSLLVYFERINRDRFESITETTLLPIMHDRSLPIENRAVAAHTLAFFAVPFTKTALIQFADEVSNVFESWDGLYFPRSFVESCFAQPNNHYYYAPNTCIVHLEELVSWPCFKSTKKKPKAAKVGRNDLCSCGSGKKFKKCCGEKG